MGKLIMKNKTNLKNTKLKTLLLYPGYNLESGFIDDQETCPPLGITLLVGYLKYLGYANIRAEDLRNNPDFNKINLRLRYQSINFDGAVAENDKLFTVTKKLISRYKPDIVGFSVIYGFQEMMAFEMAKIIKQIDKKIIIVFGGLRADPKYFKGSNSLFLSHIDALIVGDGCESLAQFINAVNGKQEFKNVPNLYFKNKRGNFIWSKNYLIEDKKKMPIPNFDDFKIKFIPLRMTDGCYWRKCTFCLDINDNKSKKHLYQVADLDYFVDGIEKLIKKYKIRDFLFFDEAVPPVVYEKFSKLLIDRKIKIRWNCINVCLDSGFLKGTVIKTMKQAGMNYVKFGLESISPRVLKLMGKIHDAESAAEIIKKFNGAGIKVAADVIFGFPTETATEAGETFDFLVKNQKLFCRIMVCKFVLWKRSFIANNPKKFGIKNIRQIGQGEDCTFERSSGIRDDEAVRIMGKLKKILKNKVFIKGIS